MGRFLEVLWFQLDNKLMIPIEGSVITITLPSKIMIYTMHFDVGYRLPSCDFPLELLDHHKIHIDQLCPNDVNNIISF